MIDITMDIILDKPEQMLFALLRSALNSTKPVSEILFTDISPALWQACYKLACTQGVMALAWDGIQTLPACLQPPKALKLNWAMAVENYEKRYRRYCHTIAELSAFYKIHGITTVQLKGVGLSTYYPIPSHREGGDIDIFTYSADHSRKSDAEANRLADRLMEEKGIEVDLEHSEKHSMFYYKGIPIENHKTFINSETYRIAVKMDKLLQKLLQPVSAELDGKYPIFIPSSTFNTVFLAFHAAQHYARGLALHHLCDWACLLNRYGLHIPEEVTDIRFRNMMLAMTHLCNDYLGTSIPVYGGEGLAEEILREIIRPPYTKFVPAKNKWSILVYKTKRMLHTHRACNSVLRISLCKWVGISILLHLRSPHTIFQTERK